MRQKISGIYAIKNKINGKMYIGQSIDINSRYSGHLRSLRKQQHCNKHLQNSFNKHGEKAFEMFVLENCDPELLGLKEQEWIDQYPRLNLYNMMFEVQSFSDIAKKAMSEHKKRAYIGKGNPNYGKKQSPESRIKISLGSGKLTISEIEKIVELLRAGLPHQEIADICGVGRTTVTRISSGERWSNITGGPIVPVTYINGKRKLSDSNILHRSENKKNRAKFKAVQEDSQHV